MAIEYKSPRALVQAVVLAKANPNIQFNVPGHWPITGDEVLANFRSGVMKRCNRGLRIADDDSMSDLQHDARIIRDAAKRIRWSGRNLLLNRKLIKRFPQVHNPEKAI